MGEYDYSGTLYDTGTVGAILFQEKFENRNKLPLELVEIRQSSKILNEYLKDSKVFIRMNCEGSEVVILKSLLEHKLLDSRHSILVDFDMLRIKPTYSIKK